MKHEESKLQQLFVAWFRAQYPQYAMLLTHVPNEGNGNRISGAIHKAEGTVKGVSDILFFMPCFIDGQQYHGLGIEFKTKSGSQSQEQKDFQKMFEAAGYRYIIAKDLDTPRVFVELWIACASKAMCDKIKETHQAIVKAAEDREREKFYKVIGKK
jgi:hypothetical protein